MRKKSNYKPKGVRLDAVNWVVQGLQPVLSIGDDITIYRSKTHSAMIEILNGRGNNTQVDCLMTALNICEAYAVHGKGSDWTIEIAEAQDALHNMASNAARTNKFVFRGNEIKAINLAMEIHELQLQKSTVQEFEKMTEFVVQQILAGKAKPIVSMSEHQSMQEPKQPA